MPIEEISNASVSGAWPSTAAVAPVVHSNGRGPVTGHPAEGSRHGTVAPPLLETLAGLTQAFNNKKANGFTNRLGRALYPDSAPNFSKSDEFVASLAKDIPGRSVDSTMPLSELLGEVDQKSDIVIVVDPAHGATMFTRTADGWKVNPARANSGSPSAYLAATYANQELKVRVSEFTAHASSQTENDAAEARIIYANNANLVVGNSDNDTESDTQLQNELPLLPVLPGLERNGKEREEKKSAVRILTPALTLP